MEERREAEKAAELAAEELQAELAGKDISIRRRISPKREWRALSSLTPTGFVPLKGRRSELPATLH
jgi:hypothetical protein